MAGQKNTKDVPTDEVCEAFRRLLIKAQDCTHECAEEGCTKRAIGSTSHCSAHGGGPRCEQEGCTKGARGSTVYCKAHGGGRRCEQEGCTKSTRGRTVYCKAHGA